MKRNNKVISILLMSFLIIMMGLSFGCSKTNKSDDGDVFIDEKQIFIKFKDYSEIKKVRYSSESKDILEVIDSKLEFDSFKQQNSFVFVEESDWVQFDSDFFEDKSLIVINVIKGHSGPQYSIKEIELVNNSASIRILGESNSNAFNDEMSCVFFVISVEKTSIKSIEDYNIVFEHKLIKESN